MSLTRKIKDFDGPTPSQSILIHPVTLRLIQDKKTDIKKEEFTDLKLFEIPEINFTQEKILESYQIKFITDLEEHLETNKKNYRIIKLFFQENKNKIKILEKNDILNVLEILSTKFKLTFDETLVNLKAYINSNKKWDVYFKIK